MKSIRHSADRRHKGKAGRGSDGTDYAGDDEVHLPGYRVGVRTWDAMMGTWRLVDAHISARYHIESLSRMFTTGKRVFLKYVQYTHDRGPMYTSVLSALTRRQAFDIQTHYTLLKSAVADRRPPRMRTLTDALSWSNDETYALYPCTIPWSPVYFLRASVSVPFAISAPFGDRDQTIWQSVKDVTERDVTSKSTKKQSRQRDPKH